MVNLLTMIWLALKSDPQLGSSNHAIEQTEQISDLSRSTKMSVGIVANQKFSVPATSGVVAALLGLAGGAGFLVLMVF